MKLHQRLLRLEKLVVDPRCRACRERRGRMVFVEVQRQPDGAMTYGDDMPQPCSVCGQVPEFVIEIGEAIVEPYPGENDP